MEKPIVSYQDEVINKEDLYSFQNRATFIIHSEYISEYNHKGKLWQCLECGKSKKQKNKGRLQYKNKNFNIF